MVVRGFLAIAPSLTSVSRVVSRVGGWRPILMSHPSYGESGIARRYIGAISCQQRSEGGTRLTTSFFSAPGAMSRRRMSAILITCCVGSASTSHGATCLCVSSRRRSIVIRCYRRKSTRSTSEFLRSSTCKRLYEPGLYRSRGSSPMRPWRPALSSCSGLLSTGAPRLCATDRKSERSRLRCIDSRGGAAASGMDAFDL